MAADAARRPCGRAARRTARPAPRFFEEGISGRPAAEDVAERRAEPGMQDRRRMLELAVLPDQRGLAEALDRVAPERRDGAPRQEVADSAPISESTDRSSRQSPGEGIADHRCETGAAVGGSTGRPALDQVSANGDDARISRFHLNPSSPLIGAAPAPCGGGPLRGLFSTAPRISVPRHPALPVSFLYDLKQSVWKGAFKRGIVRSRICHPKTGS